MQVVDIVWQDVRHAVRALARTPRFAALAVITLAAGIGVVTTMVSVVNAALVRPLPFTDARQLFEVRRIAPGGERVWTALPVLEEWQAQNRSFSALAGSTALDVNWRGRPAATISATGVTPGYLELLGIDTYRGRLFAATEYAPGSDRVVLLTYPFWRQRFSGDPDVLGKTLDLEGPSHLSDSTGVYTIVGILAPEFWHFFDRARTHIVVPLPASAAQMADRDSRLVERVIGRLPAGSPSVAAQELRAISDREDRERSQLPANMSVAVTPLAEAHFGTLRRSLLFLLAVTFVVALIASANVALLFVARGYTRRRDVAVRASLGASRLGLARLQMVESGMVALAGAGLGGVVSRSTLQLVTQSIPGGILAVIPGGADAVVLDTTTLLVVMAVTIVLAVCAGAAPAWLACRTAAIPSIRTGDGEHDAGMSVQRVLVISEVALTVTLLAAASLLVNSLIRLNRVDVGIAPPSGIVVWLNLNLSRYPDNETRAEFYRRVLDALDDHPHVNRATAVDLPFTFQWQTVPFAVDAAGPIDADALPRALDRAVGPGYFAHHGIRARRGRDFDARDTSASPAVAIVSATLARRAWPGDDPIGRRLRLVGEPPQTAEVTVVGVVSDVRAAPQQQPEPIVYRPYAQHAPAWMYLSVEGNGGASVLLEAVRDAVAGIDPFQPIDGPWTIAEWVRNTTTHARLASTLASTFAGLALLLATLGIYGLLTHILARRTRELGIRIAVGATPGRILWAGVSQGLRLSAVGIAIGLAGAVAVSRTLEGMLFGVSPLDPTSFAAVAALFAGTAAIASAIPAYRATRVDPVLALRAE